MSTGYYKAHELRRKFGYSDIARIPVQTIATFFKVEVEKEVDPDSRVRAAIQFGEALRVDDPIVFATYFLAPLSIVEPLCNFGRIRTGERWFFGLFEKKRFYSTQDLARAFDVPIWLMRTQLGKLC